jgi:AcrR family transcriptional regulator
MMSMKVSYTRTGRVAQKTRTHEALVAATRTLLAQGSTPTVEESAAAAGISRATAYRYFPNQRALLVASHPEIEERSLLGDDAPAEPAARLAKTIEEMLRIVLETEAELRTQLRLSLEPKGEHDEELVLRKGRAIGWIEDALAPLAGRLSEAELRRLVLAVRSAVGIEALVWLTDVAGLSRDDAAELMRWTAQALLRSALADAEQR